MKILVVPLTVKHHSQKEKEKKKNEKDKMKEKTCFSIKKKERKRENFFPFISLFIYFIWFASDHTWSFIYNQTVI